MKKIASKPDGSFLYREDGYFFESPLELESTSLSEAADEALRNSGKLRQAYLNKHSLNEYVVGDEYELIRKLVDLIEPTVINLWVDDKLQFCD